jgi:hypothetical protein
MGASLIGVSLRVAAGGVIDFHFVSGIGPLAF